jgi:transposase
MIRTSQKGYEWKRYKNVSVPWSEYDRHYQDSCENVIALGAEFKVLDKPMPGREFPLSKLVVLLLIKGMYGISYRSLASMTRGFGLDKILGLKRAPSYKTLQRTMSYLSIPILELANKPLVPEVVSLAGVDASGLRTTRKGGWMVIRFGHKQRKREYKKLHILVDLRTKKILHCKLTDGTKPDHTQLPILFDRSEWIKFEIVLADKGYDMRACFNSITDHDAIPGIPVRKNASPRAHGCPSRRKAVLAQQKDFNAWKQEVEYTMRAIVEGIFSGMKRRMGETLASIKNEFREIEAWIKTLLWNVTIYPR